MKRREFLELLGMPALTQRRKRRGRHPAAPPDTRWRFSLDARARWSLARAGVTAVRDAEIAIELAALPRFTLADLESARRFRTGSRRSGEGTWTIVGLLNGLEVTAQFEDDDRPVVTVRVRGLEGPRDLVAIHFTGGVSVAQTRAWINGYQSWSSCRMAELAPGTDVTGHWQLALFGGMGGRGGRGPGTGDRGPGLAFAFGETDGSAGEFRLTGRVLDAVGRFNHRAVSLDQVAAVSSLTILPSADPLGALGADAAARAGPLRPDTPAGWCSWYELYERVTEDDVVAAIETARGQFDPRGFRLIQVDDGFQRAAGDWDTNEKFPHGHRWLTDRIHAAGFEAGLWMAPFAVTARSGIPSIHPEWLLLDDTGQPLKFDVQAHWGGQAYGIDASQRVVQDWLRNLTRHAVDEWGYDYLKLDFLYYGARGGRPERGASGHEAVRAGLRALREGAGRAFVLGCGAPLQHSLGLVDGMRIGGDVDASWGGIQPGVSAAMQRAHWHGRAWRNDPDAVVVREPMSLDEGRAWASAVAISGQMTIASDRLDRLPADRIEILQRAMPAAPVRGRALDLLGTEAARAPALLAGDVTLAALPRRWRFMAGDDASWSDPALDDAGWEDLEVGIPWERAGRPGLDGYAWYRAKFNAPRRPPAGRLTLALGKIDDADETFVNGVRVGATGAMPPAYRAEWQTYRQYDVPGEAIQWGAPNVVAVRVYDGGGDGGMWRLLRDAPPSRLLCRQHDDWWTIGLFNWDNDERHLTADLAGAGVAGPLAAYDVWKAQRLADVSSRISLAVAPRSAAIIALRRPRRAPFVIGSSRHIIQGIVDIDDERWDARRHVLAGKSTQLDGRPYAITLALPPGFRPRRCIANVECTLADVTARSARLEMIGQREDVVWEVDFQ